MSKGIESRKCYFCERKINVIRERGIGKGNSTFLDSRDGQKFNFGFEEGKRGGWICNTCLKFCKPIIHKAIRDAHEKYKEKA